MATVQEMVARKLVPRIRKELGLADIRDAVLGMPAGERAEFVQACQANRTDKMGNMLGTAIFKYVISPKANAEASAMAADANFTMGDLDRILRR